MKLNPNDYLSYERVVLLEYQLDKIEREGKMAILLEHFFCQSYFFASVLNYLQYQKTTYFFTMYQKQFCKATFHLEYFL